MPTVYVIGTCDTKGEELAFAVDCVRKAGAKAVLVDVSTTPFAFMADVSAETVAACHPSRVLLLCWGKQDRGIAVAAMGTGAEALAAEAELMLERCSDWAAPAIHQSSPKPCRLCPWACRS